MEGDFSRDEEGIPVPPGASFSETSLQLMRGIAFEVIGGRTPISKPIIVTARSADLPIEKLVLTLTIDRAARVTSQTPLVQPISISMLSPVDDSASTGRSGIGNRVVFPVSRLGQRNGSRALVPLVVTSK